MGSWLWLWGCAGLPAVAPSEPVPPDEGPPDSTSPPVVPGPLVFDGDRVPTNLLAISLDTTRRDRVGRYSGADTTPFLDARLAEGVALDDHRSCSNWTAPSMVCATTGHLPLDLGFWPSSQDPLVPSIPDDLPTLARALSDRGWDTRLVSANPVFSNDFATAQGFGTVILRDWESADVIAERALEQADALLAGDAPWYLHLHFFDPHQPYCPPASYLTGLDPLPDVGIDVCAELPLGVGQFPGQDAAWQQALLDRVEVAYGGELRFFDDTLARLWGDLDARGLLDDTLVLFFTDHGEQIMERGVIDHGFQLYAEENRAVAGFWAKSLTAGAWTGPTMHPDLAATVLDLHGIPTTATGIRVGEAPDDRVTRLLAYSVVDYGVPQLSIVRGDRQLHYAWDGVRAFHHLDTDPAELVDRYDPADPELLALWGLLDPFVAEIAATWAHLPAPVRAEP